MIRFLKEYFEFSKKELNGLFVFCLLLVLIAVAPLIYSYLNPPEVYQYNAFEKEVAAFRASAKLKTYGDRRERYTPASSSNPGVVSGTLFPFNPNALSPSLWKKLGLNERQIHVIKNFEAKGGKFYRKEDLKKIYSISENDYNRLEPYISIPQPEYAIRSSSPLKEATRKKELIEINSADSVQLESISGIGPAFASRIIKYRNRLGGFYRKEQLREVYGIDSSMYKKVEAQISLNTSSIRSLSINTATFNDLKGHPYLRYKEINAIINYRKQHGPYKDISDLKKVAVLNELLINKIAPYFSF